MPIFLEYIPNSKFTLLMIVLLLVFIDAPSRDLQIQIQIQLICKIRMEYFLAGVIVVILYLFG